MTDDERTETEIAQIRLAVASTGAHLVRNLGIDRDLALAVMASEIMHLIAATHGGEAAAGVADATARKLADWPSPADNPLVTMKPQGQA